MRRRLIALVGLGLILVVSFVIGWSHGQTALAASPAAAPKVALPAVDVGGEWTSQFHIQNLGSSSTFVVVELYAVTGECLIEAMPPSLRICLGEVGASQTRTWTAAGVPPGAYAGMVMAYTTCPDTGGEPNATPLGVVMSRQRNLGGSPSRVAASAYTGLIPSYSAYNPSIDRYVYYAPQVRANVSTSGTTLSLQNVGGDCAAVRVLFFDESFQDGQQNCAGIAATQGLSIAPNGAARLTPDQAGLPVFFGNALIESTQPLAIAVDVSATNNRQLLTYTALPYSATEPRLIFPLVLSQPINPAPWLSTFKVQSVDTLDVSIVTERLYNRDGSSGSPGISQQLCPGMSRTLEVRDFSSSADFIGSAEVQNGAAIVMLVNGSLAQFEGYSGLSQSEAGPRLGLPRLRRQTQNDIVTLRSQVMVRNLGGSEVEVALALYDDEGNLVDTETNSIEANGATVFDLAGLNYLGNGWRGSGIISAVGAGSANARLMAAVLERSADEGSDNSRAYVAARVASLGATPTPSRTPLPSPTMTPTVTETPLVTPTPSLTPTQTPMPVPSVVMVTPAPNMAGYAVSLSQNTNFFSAGEMYVGHDRRPLKPIQWMGGVQFDLSSIPNTATLVSAEVQLTGKNAVYLDGATGIRWEMQLLDAGVDAGWATIPYATLAQAAVDDRLTPSLSRDDLRVGTVNVFSLSAAGLAELQARLTAGDRASFRLTATEPPLGYRAIFTWDSGNGSGAAVRKPVLKVTWR